MEMQTPQPIKTSPSVRETISQDGAVLLDIRQGVCFSMNSVGAKIWEMLKKGHSLDQIATALQSEFQVARMQIDTDIAEFINDLKERQLIQFGDGKAQPLRSWLRRLFR